MGQDWVFVQSLHCAGSDVQTDRQFVVRDCLWRGNFLLGCEAALESGAAGFQVRIKGGASRPSGDKSPRHR